MDARLEILCRSGQFSKFLSQIVDDAEYDPARGSEQDRLRMMLREELRHIESGHPKLAITNLLNIMKRTQLPHVYLLLAAAHLKAGEWETALTVLNTLDPSQTNLPQANVLKGLALEHLNLFIESESCLRAAVQQAPQLQLAWIALIETARAKGLNHKAARLLHEALRADPRHTDLLQSQLGLLLDPLFSPQPKYMSWQTPVLVPTSGDTL